MFTIIVGLLILITDGTLISGAIFPPHMCEHTKAYKNHLLILSSEMDTVLWLDLILIRQQRKETTKFEPGPSEQQAVMKTTRLCHATPHD
jgi:hypothetical protein